MFCLEAMAQHLGLGTRPHGLDTEHEEMVGSRMGLDTLPSKLDWEAKSLRIEPCRIPRLRAQKTNSQTYRT